MKIPLDQRTGIARLLSSKRRASVLSQAELCARVNESLPDKPRLTQATLSAWETGRQNPSREHLPHITEIARILFIDMKLVREVLEGRADVDAAIDKSSPTTRTAERLIFTNPIIGKEDMAAAVEMLTALGRETRVCDLLALLAIRLEK